MAKVAKIQVIQKHWDFLSNSTKRTLIMEGGSRSGKTYTVTQYYIIQCLNTPNLTVNIFRKESTTVRQTIYKDAMDILDSIETQLNVKLPIKIIQTTMTFRFTNGSIIQFNGADDERKVKGLKADVTVLDEALDFNKDVFDQINIRTQTKMVLCFNPGETEHYIYNLIPDSDYNHSTYKDNPYIPKVQIEEIEKYRELNDSYMWNVYGLGLRARREDAIYDNIVQDDYFPTDKYDEIVYGLDLAYTDHYLALVECRRVYDIWYVRTLIYDKRLILASADLNKITLQTRMIEESISKSTLLVVDSAEPRTVATLQHWGYNAVGIKKAKNSVLEGIQFVKGLKIHVSKNDPIFIESQRFVWAHNQKPIAETSTQSYDALAAMRYALSFNKFGVVNDPVKRHRKQRKVLR